MAVFSTHRWYLLVAICMVFLVAATVRLELLTVRSLWIDEALTLDLVSGGPRRIVESTRLSEPHPPGYYLLLWGWQRLVGPEPVYARIPSVVFGLLAVALTGWVGYNLAPEWAALAAAASVAFHPFQVLASNEARMYALLTAAGLAATLVLIEAVRRPGCLGRWVVYGALTAGLGYVSYYGFLLVAGHAVGVLLVVARSRSWRGPTLSAATALLCYIPWLPSLVTSLTSNPVPWRPPASGSYLLGILITQTAGGYVLGTPAYHASDPATPGWFVLATPAAVLLTLGVVDSVRTPEGLILTSSWLVPVNLVAGASLVLNKQVAYYYHLTYLQPYAALLLVLGAAGLARRVNPGGLNVVALGCAALLLGTLGVGTHLAQTGSRDVYRFDLLGHWLQRKQMRGDVTMYFAHVGQRVLRYYFKPAGPEVVISVSPRHWTLRGVRPLLEQAVAPLQAGHGRVWVVLTPPTPPGSVDELIRLLQATGYRPGREFLVFRGVSAQLFERKRE